MSPLVPLRGVVSLHAMIAPRARLVVLALAAFGAACGGAAPVEPPKDDSICTDIGFCSDSVDVCTCGTTCERLGEGHYSCEISCEKNADCTAEKHPITGASFTECVSAQDRTHDTFGKYCR